MGASTVVVVTNEGGDSTKQRSWAGYQTKVREWLLKNYPGMFKSHTDYENACSFMTDMTDNKLFDRHSERADNYCNYLDVKNIDSTTIFFLNKEIKNQFLHRGDGFDTVRVGLGCDRALSFD